MNQLKPDNRDMEGISQFKGMPDYRSSHWDEPNVLAHMRLNDRVDTNGKKTLFVEEIQSDWHQEGRKKGYLRDNDKWDIKQRDTGMYGVWDKESNTFRDSQHYLNEADARKDAVKLNSENKIGVPAAPFSKTWHELAFKKILREAAEKGYDKVAWTTGEQQAARYDLSKQVDNVQIRKNNDDTYDLRIQLKNERTISENNEYRDLPINKVEGLVGKDLAKKASKQEEDEFVDHTGDDLKVGGEGMKGFYDKILVDYANKYGKKWGAKVEDLNLGKSAGDMVAEQEYFKQEMGRKYKMMDEPWYKVQKVLSPEEKTKDIKLQKQYDEFIANEGTMGVQHSMTITPAMKKSVMEEGQPMFAVTGGAGIAGTLAAMQASRDKNKKGVSDVVSRMNKNKK
jgi:hypothetical protein